MNDFVHITSEDNWFKLHPEKIAGVEYETTSFYFPIMVKGTKEDVLRVTGMAEKPKDKPTNNLPAELLKILKSGLEISGITRIDFEDDGKTIIFGTKTNAVRYSVVGWDKGQIQAEYKFDLRTYNQDINTDFEAKINEIKLFRGTTDKEKIQMIKLVNQTKNHLQHFEKIIFPFYLFHLGITGDKLKKLTIAKLKAKAIKIKLSLQ